MAEWNRDLDWRSCRIGMAKAFCECVAADCKALALSDPVREEEREDLERAMAEIAAEHGLQVYYDPALDVPPGERLCWWVFYKKEAVIREYRALRSRGHYPARALEPFRRVLSYGIAYKQGEWEE